MVFGSAYPDPIAFTVGAFAIHWYALFIVLGCVFALAVILRLNRHAGVKDDALWDAFLFGLVVAVIGGRIAYVLSHLSLYDSVVSTFKIWEGGLSFHGALFAGVVTIFLVARKHRVSFWRLFDILAPGFILAQAIGRWGNYFNQEAFGPPTGLPWGVPIHPALRPEAYAGSTYFHPTWLYESAWNLVIFVVLIVLFNKLKDKPGVITALYFLLYYSGRFFLEFLRVDAVSAGLLSVGHYLSIVAIIFGTFFFVKNIRSTISQPVD